MTIESRTAVRDGAPNVPPKGEFKVFAHVGEFGALNAAQKWLKDNGYSYGSWQRGAPCGIMYGDYSIAKWRNMSKKEIVALHGQMEGDGRNGPIIVTIKGLS